MNQLRLLLRWFVLIWIAVIAAGPFVWILVTALKGNEDIFAFPPPFCRTTRESGISWRSSPLFPSAHTS